MMRFDSPPPCVEDPEAFFPTKGRSPRAAKALCEQCPYKEPCAREALMYGHDLVGVWGGTTDADRRKLRRSNERKAIK